MSHSHGSATGQHRWRLQLALGLVATFFVVELVTALRSGSLALLSDAGHMAADVVALCAAVTATALATRPDRTGRRTFGSYRAEVFAAGLAALIMLAVAAFVLVEALGRRGEEAEPATGAMLLVGALGLVINLVTVVLLRGGASESINVKGAYLEVLADTLGSVGVLIAGGLVAVTGDGVWDTVVALLIAAFIVVRAVMLGREVLGVLGQQAPEGAHPSDVEQALAGTPGVVEVHDVHVWTLTSGMDVATAHVAVEPGADHHDVLDASETVLRERFGIAHSTVQVEPRTHTGCDDVGW